VFLFNTFKFSGYIALILLIPLTVLDRVRPLRLDTIGDNTVQESEELLFILMEIS